jgi:S-adenosylmethionine:tRNA-ribosyltransferase-isomerase (queuine synthetase)
MFLITLLKMDSYKHQILAEIPDTVQAMDLVCLNNTAAFSKVSAPWEKVKGFLIDVVSAEDLKSSISVQSIP